MFGRGAYAARGAGVCRTISSSASVHRPLAYGLWCAIRRYSSATLPPTCPCVAAILASLL
eukprot:6946636-Prymnesium_polylepis.1